MAGYAQATEGGVEAVVGSRKRRYVPGSARHQQSETAKSNVCLEPHGYGLTVESEEEGPIAR
jgi:hypothetical protein